MPIWPGIQNTESVFEDVAAPGTCRALPAPARGMHGMNPRAALILSETEKLQPLGNQIKSGVPPAVPVV